MFERLALLAMAGSRNGLRETGRGGGSSKGDAGLVGDTARLRKGLFEERFNESPADRWSCCESAMLGRRRQIRCWSLVIPVFGWRGAPFACQLGLMLPCDRVKMSWIEFL